ncbi:MAG: hypothetical protein KBD78_11335 [Oligoflexales bacterium]|nr:hypothetical protein [Oligoflexales bacterium]
MAIKRLIENKENIGSIKRVCAEMKFGKELEIRNHNAGPSNQVYCGGKDVVHI